MHKILTARSILFVPGNRPERFDKAMAAGADAVIVDLEDAVPAAEKTFARNVVSYWLRAARPVILRINGSRTPWFRDDVALCSLAGVGGIVLPKAETREELVVLNDLATGRPIWPVIETATGFADAAMLARAPGVERLIFGNVDLQLELGITGEREELDYFRSALVLVSRLAGLEAPLDGICTAIDDTDALRAETLRNRRFGYGGKLCIHPRQIAVVNTAYCPSAADIAWAERVLAAAGAAAGSATTVDGRMVDQPIMRRAEGILADSRRHPG